MLFSSWKEDSLYPVSICRATMELSPHPNDIRVRLVDMSVPWQTPSSIVKDAFLTELVISNWFLLDPLLQLIERLWLLISLWCRGSDLWLICKVHLFLKRILVCRSSCPWSSPLIFFCDRRTFEILGPHPQIFLLSVGRIWKLWWDVVTTVIISDNQVFHSLIIKVSDNQTVSLPWLSRISDTSGFEIFLVNK